MRELSGNLSDEAKLSLNALPGTKADIRKRTDLSYALTNKAFVELEVLGLVTYEERGRGKFYTPTEAGEKLKDRPKKEAIRWKNF